MKTAGKRKITVGFVIQTFNDDNECIEQEFVPGDQVDYEDVDGEPIDEWVEDHPFNMVQPDGFGKKFPSVTIPVIGKMGKDGKVEFNV